MNNMKAYLIIFILSLTTMASQAQIESYYYYNGDKVALTINTNVFSITHKCSYNKVENLIQQQGYTTTVSNKQTFEKEENALKWSILRIENSNLTKENYKNIVQTLLNDELIESVQPVMGTNEYLAISDVFYVKLKQEEDLELLTVLANAQACSVPQKVPYSNNWYSIKTTKRASDALTLSNLFYETEIFENIDPGFIFNITPLCSDEPDFGQQWSLQNTTNPNADINICGAWDISKGDNVTIGILDEGVFTEHPEFENTVFRDAYDLITNSFSPSEPSIGYQHGMGSFGIIAANHNDNQMAGISPNSEIVNIRHPLQATVNISGEMATGINYANAVGVDVLNNSWGDDGGSLFNGYFNIQSAILNEAIEDALNEGRNGLGEVLVFSVGNHNNREISYPAKLDPRIIAVGAIDITGKVWEYSAKGNELDLVAPGVDVVSTQKSQWDEYILTSDWIGTSYAAPHVTGIIALMLSENPCLTLDEVTYYLESTARKIGNIPYINTPDRPNGTWNEEYGHGLVDAYQAVFQSSNPTLLQDITENSTVEYEKFGRIRAGNNINPIIFTGDYVINPSANITLKAMKSIHLENGTKIKAGSKFRAYIKDFSGDCNDDWYARTVPNDNTTIDDNVVTDKNNTGEVVKPNIDVEISPNPFKDAFNVKIMMTTSSNYELKVFNMIGTVVYTENGNLSKGKHLRNIPVTENSGLYIVQIRLGNNVITQKIMKHD